MSVNENNEQTCISTIPEHGTCGRTAYHPIHAQLGMTPLEHSFERAKSGVTETKKLTRRNERIIAARSGQNAGDLRRMRMVAKLQGRTLTLKYDVIPEIVEAEGKGDGARI